MGSKTWGLEDWKTYANSLSAEDRLELLDEVDIARARLKPEAFAEYVMEDEETGDQFVLADFHREWHQLMTEEPRLVLEGPREHGKSGTIVSRALWELGHNPNIRIKIICCSDGMAKKRLAAITQYIIKSEKLHKVFPNLRPAETDSWTKQMIFVERTIMSGSPSVEAFGILSSSSGSRADLMFLDDICDARNTIINPALQETVRRVLFDNVMNFLPASGGRAVYIDTPWTTTDVSNDVKANPAWKVWRKPTAIEKPLWPGRWDTHALEKRKGELPLRSWQRQFELIVIAEEGATFDHRKVEASCKDIVFVEPDGTRYFAGVDLARSGKGAYFVIEIVARTPDGKKHVVETIRRRGITLQEQRRQLKVANDRYGLTLALVESNAYQAVFLDDPDMAELTVKGYTTTGMSKRDEETGIPGFASEIERGEWTIWDAQGSNRPLVEEMKGYPFAEYSDCVLAGFFAREAVRKSQPKGPGIPVINNPHFNRVVQPRFEKSPYVRPTL